jgi:NADH-quinone oxidoreductase subunit N
MPQTLWMPGPDDLAMLGPVWVLVATLVGLMIAALLVGRNWRVSVAITIAGALLAAFVAAQGFRQTGGAAAGLTPDAAAPMFVSDQFSSFFVFLVSLFLVAVTGMYALGQGAALPDRLSRKSDATEFFVLLVGSAIGLTLMVSTTNLLMIILAIEMASLPSYAITAFRKRHRLAAEASMKYVLFGAVTSAIMIYGASLLYGQYGTFDLAQIGAAISANGGPTVLMSVSLFALIVGVAFKISAVPFHFWCPDVFQGASIEVTTWLSVASKAAGLGLLLRIISVLTWNLSSPETLTHVAQAIAVMAAITCTVGNLSAFKQTNLKRLLAFSSIAHAGYMLMAAAILWRPVGGDAVGMAHPAFSAVVFYIAVYMLMNLGAFGVIAMVYWATGKETIDAFNGLSRRSPILAVMMAVFLFSLVGLPPMGGFFAKWWLLVPLWAAGPIWLKWLVIVAVFNTLISLYYYARIAKAMVFEDDGQPAIRTPILGQAAVSACAILIVLAGTLYAGRLKDFADNRSRDLYAVVKPVAQHADAQSPVKP